MNANGKDPSTSTSTTSGSTTSHPAPKLTTLRRPPARVHEFVYDPDTLRDTPPFGDVPAVILCTEHAHPRCRGGFQAVQRLEQYAFLLNVALRRLYLLLKKQGVVPMSPGVCHFFLFAFGLWGMLVSGERKRWVVRGVSFDLFLKPSFFYDSYLFRAFIIN